MSAVGEPDLLHPRVPCPLHLQASVRRGEGGARVAPGNQRGEFYSDILFKFYTIIVIQVELEYEEIVRGVEASSGVSTSVFEVLKPGEK